MCSKSIQHIFQSAGTVLLSKFCCKCLLQTCYGMLLSKGGRVGRALQYSAGGHTADNAPCGTEHWVGVASDTVTTTQDDVSE